MFEDEPSVPPHAQPASMDTEERRMVRRVLVQPQIESERQVLEKRSSVGSSEKGEAGQKRISFSGFQPTEMQKLIANRMKLVIAGPDEDYDILVIGNDIRITTKLLKALLTGKEVKSETYINNGSGRILSKVFGHIWDDIAKKPRKNIFNETDLLYIPDTLEDYRELVNLAGGSYTATINKSMSRRVLKLVLSERDKDTYEDFKNFRKWKFFTEKALQQSIVLGEPLEKDGID
jgi:hypothetical protein